VIGGALKAQQLAVATGHAAVALARRLTAITMAGLRLVWRLRGQVLLALVAGGAVALACYLAGPLVSSAVSGLSGATGVLSTRRRVHRCAAAV
jgi:hypothetical protein